MADIVIRGMEMPTNVFDCPLNSFGICNLAQDETHCNCIEDSRPDWCPLVPLPEGHGKIIDADAIWRNMTDDQGWAFQRGLASDIELFEILEAAEAIVPAEGGTDNAEEET